MLWHLSSSYSSLVDQVSRQEISVTSECSFRNQLLFSSRVLHVTLACGEDTACLTEI